MTLTLAIPTLSRFDLLEQAVSSAMDGIASPDWVIVLDQRGRLPEATSRAISAAVAAGDGEITVVTPARQMSVGAAWNALAGKAPEGLIIASDDLRFGRDTLWELVSAAQGNPDGLLFVSPQDPLNEFALFLLTRRATDLIGPFDEGFYPAYFEDNDYRYRLKLAGHEVVRVPGCTYDHVGSATLKAKRSHEQVRHWEDFARNRARYVAKWGGLPGEETFAVPFDGNEPG